MGFLFGPTPYSGDNAGSGPSGSIWHDLPDNIGDFNIGYYDAWNLNQTGDYPSTSGAAYVSSTSGAWNGFTTYAYQNTTVADATSAGGALSFTNTTDNQGVYITRGTGCFKPKALPVHKLWFEASFQVSAITDTKHNTYVGLMEVFASTTGVPITTSDALADKNNIGFFVCADSTAGNGAIVRFVYKKAGQTAQMLTSAGVSAIDTTNITTAKIGTLVAATNMKVGFVYDPNALASQQITAYINGTPYNSGFVTNTNMTATTFPNDKFLAPIFGIMNASGSTPGSSTLNWLRVAQLS